MHNLCWRWDPLLPCLARDASDLWPQKRGEEGVDQSLRDSGPSSSVHPRCLHSVNLSRPRLILQEVEPRVRCPHCSRRCAAGAAANVPKRQRFCATVATVSASRGHSSIASGRITTSTLSAIGLELGSHQLLCRPWAGGMPVRMQRRNRGSSLRSRLRGRVVDGLPGAYVNLLQPRRHGIPAPNQGLRE